MQRIKQSDPMRRLCCVIAFAALFTVTPVSAEIEQARQMMENSEFPEAFALLEPAARAGNADAEELIGVMYAMGLGVEQDDVRAFEWYLRSAMKGHPGAQSGVGWYFETGRGIAAPDFVRAYLWYTLSAIGGDPDARLTLEDLVPRMTPEQIEQGRRLASDYRGWMYPLR